MNNQKTGWSSPLFAGMCLVLVAWAGITFYLEIRLGWPVDRSAWGHRAVAWFVNFVLVRTFIRGMQRYYRLRIGQIQ